MKRRPIILLALIVCLPIVALAIAAFRIAESEHLLVQKRYQELMKSRLADINVAIKQYVDDLQRDLLSELEADDFTPESLRAIHRKDPRLAQCFVLSADGILLYPRPSGELNHSEVSFLLQTSRMFSGKDLETVAFGLKSYTTNSATAGEGSSGNFDSTEFHPVVPSRRKSTVQQLAAVQQTSGWFQWYWDRGLNLIVWQKRPSGQIIGAALERARWMSDLIGRLPETATPLDASSDDERLPIRIQLVNSSAEIVYQWGEFEPPTDSDPFCELPLPDPLGSWRLQCLLPEDRLTAGSKLGLSLGLLASLVVLSVVVTVTAIYFLRDYFRDVKEAQQQVSFVNQVSHELRTPLTNIRMYAELLEQDLDDVDESAAFRPRERLQVILSEGQRLTRLIGNVLTFAGQQRNSLQMHPTLFIPDDAVRQIVDRFRPALTDLQLETVLELNASHEQRLDCDFLEQILGNLINNVEKYAAAGGVLKILTQQTTGESGPCELTIDVIDQGPGIREELADNVFRPFTRVDNDISYAAGTGIGLTIARQLARLHGGDLLLQTSEIGCCFRILLREPISS